MMTLLECPCCKSPSRNQTPGTTMRTVSGLAWELETKKASPPKTAKINSKKARSRDMAHPQCSFIPKPRKYAKGSFLRCPGCFGHKEIAGAEVAFQEFAVHSQTRACSRRAMFGFKMATHR